MAYEGKEDKTGKQSNKQEQAKTAESDGFVMQSPETKQDNTLIPQYPMQSMGQDNFQSAALGNFESKAGAYPTTSSLVYNPEISGKNTKSKPPPEKSVDELLKEFGDNWGILAQSIRDRVISDYLFVEELLEKTPWSKRDDLATAITFTLDKHLLVVTPKSILRMLRNQIDDMGQKSSSKAAIELLDSYIGAPSNAPVMNYEEMAAQLKAELEKPVYKQNFENVEAIINQINFSRSTLVKLQLYYKGDLMVDLGNSAWKNLFMLETKEEEGVTYEKGDSIKGYLTMEKSDESITGYSFKYIVNDKETLDGIIARYKPSIEDLQILNNWKIQGDKIIEGNAAPRNIQPGEQIIMPSNLFIPPQNETVLKINEDGTINALEKTGSKENKLAVHFPKLAYDLNVIISSGKPIERFEEIKKLLQTLEYNQLYISQLKEEYYTQTGKILVEHIADAFKVNQINNKPQQMPVSHSVIYNVGNKTDEYIPHLDETLELLNAYSNSEVNEQLLINKHQSKIKDDEIVLWTGLTMEDLVGRAHTALIPGLKEPFGEISSQGLLSALASLKFKKANIDAFLETYSAQYGDFYKHIENATQTFIRKENEHIPINRTSTLEPVKDIYALSTSANRAARLYLKPENNLYGGSIVVDEIVTSNFHLVSDKHGEHILRGVFPEGSLVKYQKTADSVPKTLYVVQGGDTLSGIGAIYKTDTATLKQMNSIQDSKVKTEQKESQSASGVIYPGDVLNLPSAALKNNEYIHVEGGKITKESHNVFNNLKYVDGGKYKVDADKYNPLLIEEIINFALQSDNATGTGSFSFDLELYIKGSLAVVFYVKVGLGGNIKMQIGDDRALEVTSKAQIRFEIGTEVLHYKKKWTIMGQTSVFLGVKHYAAMFNHDVYNFLLGCNQVMPEFVDYWDNDGVRDEIGKDYYTKSTKDIWESKFGKSKASLSRIKRKKIEAPEYVGDDRAREVEQPSQDFKNKRTKEKEGEEESEYTEVVNSVLVDTGFLQISTFSSNHEMNKDSEGFWLFCTFNVTAKNITKLIKTLASEPASAAALKNIVFKPEPDKLQVLTSLLQPKTVGFMNDLKASAISIKSLMSPEFKEKAKELQKETAGDTSKSRIKVEADGGIVVDICLQLINGEWVFQYTRASVYGKADVKKEVPIGSAGVATASAGVEFKTEYKRAVYERPGENGMSYVTTVYNGFMRQMDSSAEKDLKDEAFSRAQQARLNEKDPAKGEEEEQKIIAIYWGKYEERKQEYKTVYHTNAIWDKYKEEQQSALCAVFKNFLTPIIDSYVLHKENNPGEDAASLEWADVEGLKFITAKQAEEFLGNDVGVAIKDKENGFGFDEDYLTLDSKSALGSKTDLVLLALFEKYILFNLYKEQQKHEFDYFHYQKD